MTTVTIVLFLIFAVVASSVVSRMLPLFVPRPLVQVALGAAIGFVSHFRVELDPAVFFLLFLPPLLFLDGWRVPIEELQANRATIIELALGLVIFTVVGLGLLIHFMIPTMPLAVAFALAAVVSPTDPIAVSAIAGRVPIPKRMMRVLEGESLLNDASGLVCLRFAIAAAVTGTFSLFSAALTFLWMAAGGLAVGVCVVWIVDRLHRWVSTRLGEDIGSRILTTLLIPFAAYLVAEELHCSGILAAVAAGLTMSSFETSGHDHAAARIGGTAVWNVVQFAANGIMFVLLGEQIPAIVMDAVASFHQNNAGSVWWLGVYVLSVTAALGILRFIWVGVSLRLSSIGHHSHNGGARSVNWKLVAAISVAGVRGAVTLAAVLTLPVTLPTGAPFPERSLAIFIAAGVILVSLAIATVALPILLEGIQIPSTSATEAEVRAAGTATAKAAIRALSLVTSGMAKDHADSDIYVAAASRIMDTYRARLARRSDEEENVVLSRKTAAVERELWATARQAERDEIVRRIRERELGSDAAKKIVRAIDLRETSYRA